MGLLGRGRLLRRHRAHHQRLFREDPLAEALGAGAACFLCGRPLGAKVQWHHPVPKSRGGRDTVPVHPICHRIIHATFSNAELARGYASAEALRAHPEIAKFVAWISTKPADFHAPTRRKR